MTLARCALLALLGALPLSCGQPELAWSARPPLPPPGAWHCSETTEGSFCEQSRGACEAARRYMATRSVVVANGSLDCAPAEEVWCVSYSMTPGRAPREARWTSIRTPGADGWIHDCMRTEPECRRTAERIVADRAREGDPVADVSSCERWAG